MAKDLSGKIGSSNDENVCAGCDYLRNNFSRDYIGKDGDTLEGYYYNCHFPHPDSSAGEFLGWERKGYDPAKAPVPPTCQLMREMTVEDIELLNAELAIYAIGQTDTTSTYDPCFDCAEKVTGVGGEPCAGCPNA